MIKISKVVPGVTIGCESSSTSILDLPDIPKMSFRISIFISRGTPIDPSILSLSSSGYKGFGESSCITSSLEIARSV